MRLQPLFVLSLAAAAAACAARTNPSPEPVPSHEPAVTVAPPRDSLPSYDEITRQTVDVFGDSVVPEALLVDAGELEEAEEISWDIDVRSYETHARVEHYVGIFSGDARVRIGERLSRGTAYEQMIRSKLRSAGLPEDIYYLALIESGYDPHARSRAMAIGMWQFMTTTAKGLGMRVDWWVDERRDPFRSTDGAIAFLRSLQRQFGGSLYLAAAAYNGGPGRISRGLTRFAEDLDGTTGDDLAFALSERNYLPSETRNYVPQLIAAALVGKEPARYGIEVLALPPVEYDSVHVGETTPLAAVARASGATLDEVSELNPHILRGVTPPRQAFWVRIPVGRAEGFAEAFSAMDAQELVAFTRVSTGRGDTFATVARDHRMTVEQLGWYNQRDRTRRGALPVRTVILVPTRDVLSAARSIPDPALERYSSSARTHTVRSGETLSHISRRYRVSVAQLMRQNGMRSTVIRPGQRIIVSR
ncbi:MAG TPA: transglycosylase SLT domain-containing protein [Gemmatimonadaceae bacterium]|nr:transglycosylase SLT domain-containing protein [Gemmatimonadaceae bacterium]